MKQLRPTDVREVARQVAGLDRNEIDGSALYGALDELYDALLGFFNQAGRDG